MSFMQALAAHLVRANMLARRRFERRGKHAVRRDQNAQAGIWENWKQPASGQWMRTLAIVTTDEAGGHFKTVRR
jgi:putative SOS response-associated peptidase YedK